MKCQRRLFIYKKSGIRRNMIGYGKEEQMIEKAKKVFLIDQKHQIIDPC